VPVLQTGFWQDAGKKKKKIKAERVLQDSKGISTFPFYPWHKPNTHHCSFFLPGVK